MNRPTTMTLDLGRYEKTVRSRIAALEKRDFVGRLWFKDPGLWTDIPREKSLIRDSLGWIHGPEKMEEGLPALLSFASEVKAAGFRHVVHMGMGGSSLAPLAFQRIFSPGPGAVPLTVLDTTDPATILRIERGVPLRETLFIVASKSGTTAEALAFGDYFRSRLKGVKGEQAGENFIAITDPDTPLVASAQERGFRRVFLNFSDIGGRFSALSWFGLVPAALMGVDVSEILNRALRMSRACAPSVPAQDNPGLVLGTVLGEMARRGRDKVTFVMPESISAFGMWIEQLLAESTGKKGKGIMPVAGEDFGDPKVYGKDRLFVQVRLTGETDDRMERGMDALRGAGHPSVMIRMDDRLDIGKEFFRWEVATAVAGSILKINPFDQPNVQETKENTDRLLNLVRKQKRLPDVMPPQVDGPLSLYTLNLGDTLIQTLRKFLRQARPGNYIALMAYLTEDPSTNRMLQSVRLRLRDRLRVATTLGYGPRFLHSTGQLHKGGPNNGLFLQLTADDIDDVAVPGQPYTFGAFKLAQALGDLEALRKHRRKVLRIHLGSDVSNGLSGLEKAIDSALGGGKKEGAT